MSNFIENSNRAPELLESQLKSLITPVANFVATLTEGAGITVELVGDDEVVYGTFTLTALNVPVASGLLTALPARMRFRVTAGTGSFNIRVVITP
jgi:hypothetical protein